MDITNAFEFGFLAAFGAACFGAIVMIIGLIIALIFND